MVEIKQINGPESILLYDKNDLVDAIAYALYYTANPEKMKQKNNVNIVYIKLALPVKTF